MGDYRFERKIPLTETMYGEFLYFMKTVGEEIIRPFPKRRIFSLYFDNLDLEAFYDNGSGVSSREKLRLRWYSNEVPIDRMNLEVKGRQNGVGGKIVESIPPIEIWGRSFRLIHQELLRASTSEVALYLRKYPIASMFSQYDRDYFLYHDIRITIDRSIFSKSLIDKSVLRRPLKRSDLFAVLEVKYDIEKSDYVNALFSLFPLRISKNSKYMNGVEI